MLIKLILIFFFFNYEWLTFQHKSSSDKTHALSFCSHELTQYSKKLILILLLRNY